MALGASSGIVPLLPLPPAGVEITWNVSRGELERGIGYQIALDEGKVRFFSGEEGIAIDGDNRAGVVRADCSARFKRADADADGTVNLTDPIFLLTHLFLGGEIPDLRPGPDAGRWTESALRSMRLSSGEVRVKKPGTVTGILPRGR